ncbi:MAG TPA: LysE family translocator [Syntrophorhabdus sp.]|jgi:threonine/homoserine/homoserine lactone efflux protein|nr:LysE family translocator [Syntrophorhabdus sp.]
MIDPAILNLFIPASLLLIIAPGPDILFVVAQGISSGRRAGFFTALGLAFGNSVHTLAAALGVSLIFKTSVMAFTVFKIAGALYLFYLAYKVIKHRKVLMKMSKQDSKPIHYLIAKGFIMNVLNPKVALFFLAFLPQFVAKNAGNPFGQILILGAIFIILVVIIFGAIGLTAGTFGQFLTRSRTANETLNWLCAFVFIGLGIKLVLSRA